MYYYLDDENAIFGNASAADKKNAGFKAKKDAYEIMRKHNLKPFYLKTATAKEVRNNKLNRSLAKIKANNINYRKFKESVKSLSKKDAILIQVPFYKQDINMLKCVRYLKSKAIKVVYLVHDLDMLRYTETATVSEKIKKCIKKSLGLTVNNEKEAILLADLVILHNERMISEAVKRGLCDKEKVISLDLFDYLVDKYEAPVCKTNEIMIAGNLAISKVGYIGNLPDDVEFGLYGVNFDVKIKKDNINYYGSFAPDDLVSNLNGKYGLVWDGNSADTCTGMMGNYLRYNNPHKTSLFLACGIPVITWKEAAVADFVLRNKCGVVVESLMDVKNVIDKIDECMYEELRSNAVRVGEKLRSGYMLGNAITKSRELLRTGYGVEV